MCDGAQRRVGTARQPPARIKCLPKSPDTVAHGADTNWRARDERGRRPRRCCATGSHRQEARRHLEGRGEPHPSKDNRSLLGCKHGILPHDGRTIRPRRWGKIGKKRDAQPPGRAGGERRVCKGTAATRIWKDGVGLPVCHITYESESMRGEAPGPRYKRRAGERSRQPRATSRVATARCRARQARTSAPAACGWIGSKHSDSDHTSRTQKRWETNTQNRHPKNAPKKSSKKRSGRAYTDTTTGVGSNSTRGGSGPKTLPKAAVSPALPASGAPSGPTSRRRLRPTGPVTT